MAESDCQRGIVWYKRTFGKISFGIGVVLNSIVVLTCVPIAVHALYLPTRPMLWTGFVMLLEAGGVVVGLPLSVAGLILDTKKKYAGWGMVLSVTPFPLAVFLLNVLLICGFKINT